MTTRSKALENAVRTLLDVKGFKYISSKNQAVKCYKCGSFQQVRTQGFDFLVFWPIVMMIECKTGAGRLSGPQKEMKALAESVKISYIIVRDTIDELLKAIS